MTHKAKLIRAQYRRTVADQIRLMSMDEVLEFDLDNAGKVRSNAANICRESNFKFSTWVDKVKNKIFIVRIK